MKRKIIYIFIHLIITVSLVFIIYCDNYSTIETNTVYVLVSSPNSSSQCKKPDVTNKGFTSIQWDYNPSVSMYKIYYNFFEGYCTYGNICINADNVVEQPCVYNYYPHVGQTTYTTYNIPVSTLTTSGSSSPFTSDTNWNYVQCLSIKVEPICGSFIGEAGIKNFWSSTE